MSSFGSGFASGMGQGMAMGKMLLDTYNEYDQKDKLRKAGEESPTEIGSLTKEQQITADHVNNADNGYEVQKLDNGGFQYRTAGSENDWTTVDPGAKKWKLGDQTRDTAFTQDEIDRYRVGKQAKVLMDAGDVKGAYGMKALAREDRKGQQWEDIADQERMFLTDMASSGGQLSEGSKAILTKAAGVYNQNQGRHNDGRILSYDWDSNQAIFTDTKTGDIVDRQPINGKTATFVGNEYFNHLRSALDPKFGLDVRNTVSGERKADAAVTSATADMQYKGTGGVAERVGMAGVNARAAGGGGMSAKAFDAKVNSLAANAVKVGEKGPDGQPLTLDQAKHLYGQLLIKNSEYGAPKVNADGSIVQGGNVYVPDPNTPGQYIQAKLPNSGVNPIVAAFANADPSKLNKGGNSAPAAKPESQLGLGQSLRIKSQGVDSEIARTKASLDKARSDAKASDSPEEWGDTISTYEKQLAALEAIKNKKGK